MIRHTRPLAVVIALLIGATLTPVALGAGAPAAATGASQRTGLLDTDPGFDGRRRGLAYPDAVSGSYSPKFLHQTLNNCAFASAVMLLDKWTGGAVRPSQDKLRAASGVPALDGVGFSRLSRAVGAVTGIDMRYSPRGGDRLTWDQLMQRLGKGAGAVIGGNYSSLPAHYQRWAPSFAALGPKLSGHAVYVERFEPGKDGGRVWLMDPLGRGTRFKGEWISANDLRAFAWRYAGGYVAAAATPEPKPGKALSAYRIRDPQLAAGEPLFAGRAVDIQLPIRVKAGRRAPDDLTLATLWQPLSLDPDLSAWGADADTDAAGDEAGGLDATDLDDPTDPTSTSGHAGTAEPAEPAELTESAELAEPASTGQVIDWRDDILIEQRMARLIMVNNGWLAADDTESGMVDDIEPLDLPEPATEDPEPWTEEQTTTAEPVETLSRLTARGQWLRGKIDVPAASGTYQLSFELRDGEGASFADGLAPEFQPVVVRVLGEMAAEYGELEIAPDLPVGSTTTVSVNVTNLGTRDWLGDDRLELAAIWVTQQGISAAGSTPVELASGQSTTVSFDTMVPANGPAGSLSMELVTADGIPFSALGLEPVRAELEFVLPASIGPDVPRGQLSY